MRFREINGGIQVVITNEQEELIQYIEKESRVKKKDLNERQQELARLLTSRGVLKRIRLDDGFYYHLNSVQDSWRL